MKKRLRKKKRVGEFQEFGFEAGFRFSTELDTKTRTALLDRFLEQAIEKNGLQFGGGGGGAEWDGFAAVNKARASATDHHREAVKQWFLQEPEITEYFVSALIDNWYGDLDNVEKIWIKKGKE